MVEKNDERVGSSADVFVVDMVKLRPLLGGWLL